MSKIKTTIIPLQGKDINLYHTHTVFLYHEKAEGQRGEIATNNLLLVSRRFLRAGKSRVMRSLPYLKKF